MTDWSDKDGFTILTGDNLSGIYGILPSSGNELYIQTNIYGNLKLDKSLLGNLEAAPNIVEQTSLDYHNEGYVSDDPKTKHNQTRIENGRLLLDGTELKAPEITPDVVPKDTVVSAGPAKLVSVSLSTDQNDADVYLVNGSHVELLDRHRPLYRKLTNPNNTFWITTADAIYDVHHISWLERNLWLIGIDGIPISLNKQLNSNNLRVLSELSDGSLIVSASKEDSLDEQTFSDIYRVASDGKTVKMLESQKGKIYADNSGAVYVLSPSENR
jgi:hypothetical protein